MKTPIEPSDIRKDDLIRAERKDDAYNAHEYRALSDGDADGWNDRIFRWFLIDRPKKLLYPAGTHLWLTRAYFPWEMGGQIELAKDWFKEDGYGVVTDSSPRKNTVPIDLVTDVRPTPPVTLPEVPTLGWLDGEDGRMLAHWLTRSGRVISDPKREGLEAHAVTAFTEATAVPKARLDGLREIPAHGMTAAYLRAAITNFLRAVDAAGEGK